MDDSQREMSLREWAERLPLGHRARVELDEQEIAIAALQTRIAELERTKETYKNVSIWRADRIARLKDQLAKAKDYGFAAGLKANLVLKQERIAELEGERSVCPECQHVRLYANLSTPCPHCMIDALDSDLNQFRCPGCSELVHHETVAPDCDHTPLDKIAELERQLAEAHGLLREFEVEVVRMAVLVRQRGGTIAYIADLHDKIRTLLSDAAMKEAKDAPSD